MRLRHPFDNGAGDGRDHTDDRTGTGGTFRSPIRPMPEETANGMDAEGNPTGNGTATVAAGPTPQNNDPAMASIPQVSTIRVCCLYHRIHDGSTADPANSTVWITSRVSDGTLWHQQDHHRCHFIMNHHPQQSGSSTSNTATSTTTNNNIIAFRARKVGSIGGHVQLRPGKRYLFVTPYASPYTTLWARIAVRERSVVPSGQNHVRNFRKRMAVAVSESRSVSPRRAMHSGTSTSAHTSSSRTHGDEDRTPTASTPQLKQRSLNRMDLLYPWDAFERAMAKEMSPDGGRCGLYELQRVRHTQRSERGRDFGSRTSFTVCLPGDGGEENVEAAQDETLAEPDETPKIPPCCRCDVLKQRMLVHREIIAHLLSEAGRPAKGKEKRPASEQRQRLDEALDSIYSDKKRNAAPPTNRIWNDDEIDAMWANPWGNEAVWRRDVSVDERAVAVEEKEDDDARRTRHTELSRLRLALFMQWKLLPASTSSMDVPKQTLSELLLALRGSTDIPASSVTIDDCDFIATFAPRAEQELRRRVNAIRADMTKSKARLRLLTAIGDMLRMMRRVRTSVRQVADDVDDDVGVNSDDRRDGDDENEEDGRGAGDDENDGDGRGAGDDENEDNASRASTHGTHVDNTPARPIPVPPTPRLPPANPLAQLQARYNLQTIHAERMAEQDFIASVEQILALMEQSLEALCETNRQLGESAGEGDIASSVEELSLSTQQLIEQLDE